MTKEKKPNFCDLCARAIESEMQYFFRVEQKHPWGSKLITQGANMDCCHECFLGICKKAVGTEHQYKPNWKYLQKNPAYTKENSEPWTIPRKTEDTKQEVIAAI